MTSPGGWRLIVVAWAIAAYFTATTVWEAFGLEPGVTATWIALHAIAAVAVASVAAWHTALAWQRRHVSAQSAG